MEQKDLWIYVDKHITPKYIKEIGPKWIFKIKSNVEY